MCDEDKIGRCGCRAVQRPLNGQVLKVKQGHTDQFLKQLKTSQVIAYNYE